MVLAAEQVVASWPTTAEWITAGCIVVGGVGLGQVLRRLAVRTMSRGEEERLAVEVVGRFITTLVAVAAVLYAVSVVLDARLGPLVGALGIGGLAIAFAAQTILANFLASVILQVRRPFRRGDQVETNECEGTVEDINFRTVVLRTYSGERVQVPCAEVLNKPVVNHTTLGRRRTTLEIGVSYDTDLDQAQKVMIEAVREVDEVRDQPEPEVWVKEFAESGINFAVRFWHPPDVETMWRVRSAVAMAAKRALDQHGITIPVPQRVLHFAESRSGESDQERDRDEQAASFMY
jgi:small-conductance mechanosensitive channel